MPCTVLGTHSPRERPTRALLVGCTLWIGATSACGARTDLSVDVGEADGATTEAAPYDGGTNAPLDATPVTGSCAAGGKGTTDCGPTHVSCCTSPLVSGGTFARAYANDGTGPRSLSKPATLSDFRLDAFDVTVGRFRAFVAAWKGGFEPAAGSGKHVHLNGGNGLASAVPAVGYEPGWMASDDSQVAPSDDHLLCDPDYATWTPSASDHEDLPVNCVNWAEAYAFCIWDGGFLPSEAEWEYAAAAGAEQRDYPWGSADPGTTSAYAIYNCEYPTPGTPCAGLQNIAPVGTAWSGAGTWGQVDLAGEMYQWTADVYGAYTDSCVNCANVSLPAAHRVFRGAGFTNDESILHPPTRAYDNDPQGRYNDIGFRCARTP